MRPIASLLFFICFLGCSYNNPPNCYPNNEAISDPKGFPKDSLVPYWPSKTYKDTGFISTELDTVHPNWNSLDLSDAKEPLLYNYYLNKEIYRLIKGCHFEKPEIIKIEKTDHKIILTRKVFDRLRSLSKSYSIKFELPIVEVEDSAIQAQNQRAIEFNKTGKMDFAKYPQSHAKLISYEQKELGINEWNHFKALLEKAKFWEQPIDIKYELTGTFDGCGYIFEGHRKDDYWFISRSDVNVGTMKDCIEYLLTIK